MKALLDLAVPAITFLLLLAVGIDLAPIDFARVGRQRRVLAVGLVGPLLVLPPLALLLIALARPSPDLQMGLLLVASCPIGGISNTYTVPLATLFVATSFLAGWLIGGATGASPPDRFTLATEFATRNIAVAAALALTLAGRVEFAFFATAYFLTEIPLMVGATLVYRRSRQVA